MNWNIVYEYIFGSMTIEFVFGFYLFASLGIFLTHLIHLNQAKINARKKKIEFKFNTKFWIKDNWIRIVTNVLFIFVIIRFYDSLHFNYKLDMFLGFIVGLSIDSVIIFIRKKTTLNIFQINNIN